MLRAEPAFERLQRTGEGHRRAAGGEGEHPDGRGSSCELIQEIQTDEWWQDVTPPMLETARKRLRALVKLIDKQKRKPIYTDFEDQIGDEAAVELPGFAAPDSFERFRAKARAFLNEHEDHIAIHKLRMNSALTATDLDELERMLAESGVGGARGHRARQGGVATASACSCARWSGWTARPPRKRLPASWPGKTLSANQIEFVNLIVDHLTEHGVMDAALLYESPFTDLTPHGPDGLFTSSQVDELMAVLAQVKSAAIAA